MELFEKSDQYAVIPPEYKIICFRVNSALNTSPRNSKGSKLQYPRTGHIKSLTDRGFFGIRLDQPCDFAVILASPHYDTQFAILEVDARKLIQDCRTEIEFTEANILFTGPIDEFIVEVQKYATPEEYINIYFSFVERLCNYEEVKSNPAKEAEVFAKNMFRSIDRANLKPESAVIYDKNIKKVKEIASTFGVSTFFKNLF